MSAVHLQRSSLNTWRNFKVRLALAEQMYAPPDINSSIRFSRPESVTGTG